MTVIYNRVALIGLGLIVGGVVIVNVFSDSTSH